MVHQVPARLIDGPHGGYRDVVRLPAPDLVTVSFCAGCRRDHLHRVHGHALSTAFPTYLRDPGRDHNGIFAYVFVDVDEFIALCLEEARLRSRLEPA